MGNLLNGGGVPQIAREVFELLPKDRQTSGAYADVEAFSATAIKQLQAGAVSTSEVIPGYLNDARIEKKPFPNLENGDLKTVHALILHRTNTATAKDVLDGYKKADFGAHFLIDTDGTIYQTASLNKKTQHVGKIRSRCYEEESCSEKETKIIKPIVNKPTPLYNYEKVKAYPDRYPMNSDSIGIEVVGMGTVEKGYGPPTAEQLESVNYLAEKLKEQYKLTDSDIYRHGVIARKDEPRSEGAFLGY